MRGLGRESHATSVSEKMVTVARIFLTGIAVNENDPLTKMNWNNTQFDDSEQIVLKAARRVGDILKYVDEDHVMQTRYSFYM